MSIAEVESIFSKCLTVDTWSIYLLKYKHPKNKKSEYVCCPVQFYNKEDISELLKSYIDDVVKVYSDKKIAKFAKVLNYDGSCDSSIIYKLTTGDSLVYENFKLFTVCLSKPDESVDAIEFNPNACIVEGYFEDEGKRIMLISLKQPIKCYKHRFRLDKGVYVPASEKTLTLPANLDAIIYGDDIYFLNMQVENLFDMERASSKVAQQRVYDICEHRLLSNNDSFSSYALSGHNKRRFMSFKIENLQYCDSYDNRQVVSERLNISLTDDGLIKTEDAPNVERFIKFLCGKAAINIVGGHAIEVTSTTTRWE